MGDQHEKEERPFEPERRGSWRGSARDLVVNPSEFQKDLTELVERYHGHLRSDLSVDDIVSKLRRAFKEEDSDDAMQIANDLLEGHGVEALGPVDMHDGPPYLYVNMGDTYAPTIIWSRDENKFFVSDYGSVWENEGEEKIFDEGWSDWLGGEFERKVKKALEVEFDTHEEGLGKIASEEELDRLIEVAEDDSRGLFDRALADAQSRGSGASRKYPEISYESDGGVYVHNLDTVVDVAVELLLQESATPEEQTGFGFKPNAEDWAEQQKHFIERLESLLEVGDRQVNYRSSPTQLFVNFYNLPRSVVETMRGGGAEAENNRMMFVVAWPRRQGVYRDAVAIPEGKLRVEQSVSALPREYRLRARTATPSQIAAYLAEFLNRVAREVEPRLTHTGRLG